MAEAGVAGQFMLGSSGTAGNAPAPDRCHAGAPARPAPAAPWPGRPVGTAPTPSPSVPTRWPRRCRWPRRPVGRPVSPGGPDRRVDLGRVVGSASSSAAARPGPLVLVGQAVEEGQGRAHRLGHLVGGGQVGERAPDLALDPARAIRAGRARPRRSAAPPGGACRAPARSGR